MTAKFGPIDILVNNAGIGSSTNPKPVADFNDEFWELTLNLNLTVPYKLSKAVLPHMRKQHWGRIINIASINSKMPSLHGAAYAASKHGLLGLTRTLALEVAREGITVNAICPGPVHTIMNDKRIEYDAQRRGMTFKEIEQAMTPMAAAWSRRTSPRWPFTSPAPRPAWSRGKRTTSAAGCSCIDSFAPRCQATAVLRG